MQHHYQPATDSELFLTLLGKLGCRYDSICADNSKESMDEWAQNLLVQWAEEYAEGYHQEPRKPN